MRSAAQRVASAEKMEGRSECNSPALNLMALAGRFIDVEEVGLGGVEEVELGGEPDAPLAGTDPALQMFVVEPRVHRIPLTQWAVAAKARAQSIRFGNERCITWWEADHKPYPLERVRLRADTGVHQFQINAAVCEQLRLFVTDGSNYTSEGFLKMADTQFPGYGGYPYVHATFGHVPSAQEKRTTRVHGKYWVNKVLKSVQQLWDLVTEVRRMLGLPVPTGGVLQKAGKGIVGLHVLTQDATQQAVFSWHDDGEDISSNTDSEEMTTVIVNLSDECSGMRIWGSDPVLYHAQGDAVAFPGRALHESLPRCTTSPASDVVYKVALFFN